MVPSAGFCSNGHDAEEDFFKLSSICKAGKGMSDSRVCFLRFHLAAYLGTQDLEITSLDINVAVQIYPFHASLVGG